MPRGLGEGVHAVDVGCNVPNMAMVDLVQTKKIQFSRHEEKKGG